MALTKATKSPLRCRGFDGRHHDIFTGFEYAKAGHGKLLCKACRDKIQLDKCSKFFNELIKKGRVRL
jgi:hypothetical protein